MASTNRFAALHDDDDDSAETRDEVRQDLT